MTDIEGSIEALINDLRRPGVDSVTQGRLMRTMITLILRQFRKDVVAALEKELTPAYRERVLSPEGLGADDVSFSYDGIVEAFDGEPSLISGNQTLWVRSSEMIEVFFGHKQRVRTATSSARAFRVIDRTYFEHKSFRITFDRCYNEISQMSVGVNAGLLLDWIRRFRDQFFREHWLIPYPDPKGSLISTAKDGRRQWWQVKRVGNEWQWARNQTPQNGMPGLGISLPPPDTTRYSDDVFSYLLSVGHPPTTRLGETSAPLRSSDYLESVGHSLSISLQD
jgi:hypothetical protein